MDFMTQFSCASPLHQADVPALFFTESICNIEPATTTAARSTDSDLLMPAQIGSLLEDLRLILNGWDSGRGGF